MFSQKSVKPFLGLGLKPHEPTSCYYVTHSPFSFIAPTIWTIKTTEKWKNPKSRLLIWHYSRL